MPGAPLSVAEAFLCPTFLCPDLVLGIPASCSQGIPMPHIPIPRSLGILMPGSCSLGILMPHINPGLLQKGIFFRQKIADHSIFKTAQSAPCDYLGAPHTARHRQLPASSPHDGAFGLTSQPSIPPTFNLQPSNLQSSTPFQSLPLSKL
jgi:hypothetical protein